MPRQTPQSAPWLVLRHSEQDHAGCLADVMREQGFEYLYLDLFRGDRAPEDLRSSSGLIILGGSMGVYEAGRYRFLVDEQRLIRRGVTEGLPVLGICLGAQLIAASLGANVYRGARKELGWHEVEVAAQENAIIAGVPPRFMAFHWHGDTFDLPQGATRLFRSALYQNQGFRYGPNVLALQFHLEITAEMVNDWLADAACQRELAELPDMDPRAIRQQTTTWAGESQKVSKKILTNFFRLVDDEPGRAKRIFGIGSAD